MALIPSATQIRVVIFIATLIGFGGCFLAGQYKGRVDADAACKVKAVTQIVEVVRQQNEIRRNRPDVPALVERLRNGSF